MGLVVGVIPSAWAEDPPAAAEPFATAELDYKVEAGLACPTEAELRARVQQALFYDPFNPTPVPRTGWRVRVVGVPRGRLRIVIGREGRKLVVRVSFADTGNKPVMSTAFDGAPLTERTCRHIVLEHVVEEVSVRMTLEGIYLAHERPPRPAPAPAPACPTLPDPASAPPCPDSRWSIWPTEWPLPPLEKPKPDPPQPLDRFPFALRFSAATWVESIASGWGSWGFSGGVGARYHAVSLDAEVHGDPTSASNAVDNVGNVRFARISGALLLCGHFGWFEGCGVSDTGRFIFPDPVPPLPATTFYGSLGVRMGFNLPVDPPRVFIHAAVDLRAPVNTTSFAAKGMEVFSPAGFSGGLGFGLTYELPFPRR